MINLEIFREYDIRGIADRDLTSPVVEALGRGFAEYLRPRGATTVTIGFDARLSSPRLRDAIAKGLTGAGMNVIDLGLCLTPALYYSMYHLKPDAGIMITGSHNPAEFNGFKLCVGKETIYGEEIQKLRRIIESGVRGQESGEKSKPGTVSQKTILSDYISYLKKQFTAHHDVPLKVVLDSGNGTGGLVAPEVMRAMGCEVIELYSEPDGRFPNHHPDPTIPGNLTTLIETVKQSNADMGVAFDGDSDRIGVVDEKGSILWGDQLMVIFSRDILLSLPGATFVSEVKCSQTMYDDIRAHGGNAVMWKTGHSLIKAKMKELGAALAGEMSGHIFFADRYLGYDDAIYAACRLAEILKKNKIAHSSSLIAKGHELSPISHEPRANMPKAAVLSSLLADLPRTFNTPEIRFDCPDNIKFKVVEQAMAFFNKSTGLPLKPREIITVDGIRAIFENGWGLIRASNTQPVLVMRFEADSPDSLKAIQAMMEDIVRRIIKDTRDKRP